MKNLFTLFILLSFYIVGCYYPTSKTQEPKFLDTLIVNHQECTGCLDAIILQGKITIPDSMPFS